MFSIIIPTYNRVDFLKKTVPSVLNQTFQDFELIIVDDASTDDTLKYIQSLNDKRVIYTRNIKNRGVSYSRNKGIRIAKYDWIAFLDSDDAWEKKKLELQYSDIQKNPNIKVFYTDEHWIKNGKYYNQRKYHIKKSGDIFDLSLERVSMSPSSIVIHKDVFKHVGLFREDFPAAEDYDLWLKITLFYDVYFNPKKLVIKHGGHGDQLSSNIKPLDLYRVISLFDILRKYYFFLDEKKLTLLLKTLSEKLTILKQGALKRNNVKVLEVVNEIEEKISKRFNINFSFFDNSFLFNI